MKGFFKENKAEVILAVIGMAAGIASLIMTLAMAFRSGKEKGEEKDMFFRKWKEKKKDKEITDRLNELISQYRRECIWYMIKSEMSEEEVQKQDVSDDHLMESALREAIKATREMSEEIRRKKRCATESE